MGGHWGKRCSHTHQEGGRKGRRVSLSIHEERVKGGHPVAHTPAWGQAAQEEFQAACSKQVAKPWAPVGIYMGLRSDRALARKAGVRGQGPPRRKARVGPPPS